MASRCCCCTSNGAALTCDQIAQCIQLQATPDSPVTIDGSGAPSDPYIVGKKPGPAVFVQASPEDPGVLNVSGIGTEEDPYIIHVDCGNIAACVCQTLKDQCFPVPLVHIQAPGILNPITISGTGTQDDPYLLGGNCTAIAACVPEPPSLRSLTLQSPAIPKGLTTQTITNWAELYNDLPATVASGEITFAETGIYLYHVRASLKQRSSILDTIVELGLTVQLAATGGAYVTEAQGDSGSGVLLGVDATVTLSGVIQVTNVAAKMRVTTIGNLGAALVTAGDGELFLAKIRP